MPVVKGADERNLVVSPRHQRARREVSHQEVVTRRSQGNVTVRTPARSFDHLPADHPRARPRSSASRPSRSASVVTKVERSPSGAWAFLSLSWDHRMIDGAEAASPSHA